MANLESLELRRPWLLVAALAALAVGLLTGTAIVFGSLLATAGALLWLAMNPDLGGRRLIAAGMLLNAVAIVANGGMPVDPVAAAAAVPDARISGGRHILLDEGTTMAWAVDRIPLPPLGIVVSIGDILLAIGVAALVYRGSRLSISPASSPVGGI